MGFLDNLPRKSPFLRLREGENRLRILDDQPAFGWLVTKDGRIFRLKKCPNEEAKLIWVVRVYNQTLGLPQIWEISQKTVQSAIESIVQDPQWADPREFDIKVIKSGSGKETKYRVFPCPSAPLEEEKKRQIASFSFPPFRWDDEVFYSSQNGVTPSPTPEPAPTPTSTPPDPAPAPASSSSLSSSVLAPIPPGSGIEWADPDLKAVWAELVAYRKEKGLSENQFRELISETLGIPASQLRPQSFSFEQMEKIEQALLALPKEELPF